MSEWMKVGLVPIACAVLLTLAPATWAQQEVMAPLNLNGELGAGYSGLQDGGYNSGPAFHVDADLNGYWRDPRILLFDVSPYGGTGIAWANGSDVSSSGNGFSSSTTLLGGSPFPLSITYSRVWQNFPGVSSASNVVGGFSTAYSSQDLGVDLGVYLPKFPPVALHYGSGGSSTDLSEGLGNTNESHHTFSATTYYSLLGWRLDTAYSRYWTKASVADLLNLSGPELPESSRSSDLHGRADRSLPLKSTLSLDVGRRSWQDSLIGLQSDNSYDYARAVVGSHPFSQLGLNMNAGYISNATAEEIQQLLGVNGANLAPSPIQNALTTGRELDYGGGAQYQLPKGFSVNGDATGYSFNGSLGLSGDSVMWDAALNYVYRFRRSGSFNASYAYQHTDTEAGTFTGLTTGRTLRVGFSNMFSGQLQFGANMHFDQRDIESTSVGLGQVDSPEHGWGFTVSAARPLNPIWRLSGDFEINRSMTSFPLQVESNSEGFGLRAESTAFQLSMRRMYQEGLSVQVGNGLIFVGDPQGALLTPLGAALSNTSNVQTILMGTYRPGRKRFSVSGSWSHFGYDNGGRPATDATMIYGLVSYRLRRLRLQAGYASSNSQLYGQNTSNFGRREFYFEMIRNFRIF